MALFHHPAISCSRLHTGWWTRATPLYHTPQPLNHFLHGSLKEGSVKKTILQSHAPAPRKALRGGISKVNSSGILSFFGDKCPQNGSKNEPMAPTTNLECPHIKPRMVLQPRLQNGSHLHSVMLPPFAVSCLRLLATPQSHAPESHAPAFTPHRGPTKRNHLQRF